MKNKRIVLASNNPGKIREFQQMLGCIGYEVVSQSQLNVSEAEEPFFTFVENALAKARHVAKETGLPALADDSGLCVNALNGAPGVISARYAGEPKSDERNNQKLIKDLKPFSDKTANYYCVLVYVKGEHDPQPIIVDGTWHGEIIDTPLGQNGFGYDPFFLIPSIGKTAAQLSSEQKNKLSHRGQALARLLKRLS